VTDGNVRANRKQKELRDDPRRDSLIELEFNGEETTGLFSAQHGGELWSPLIALPQLSAESTEYVVQNTRADRLFRDRLGVVTGLLGLDGEHDFHTELHPVLALAVDVSHELPDRYGHAWLVLVRNMGNEGECSAGQVPWVGEIPLGTCSRYHGSGVPIPWSSIAARSRFGFIARRTADAESRTRSGAAVRLVADLPAAHTHGFSRHRLWDTAVAVVRSQRSASERFGRSPHCLRPCTSKHSWRVRGKAAVFHWLEVMLPRSGRRGEARRRRTAAESFGSGPLRSNHRNRSVP